MEIEARNPVKDCTLFGPGQCQAFVHQEIDEATVGQLQLAFAGKVVQMVLWAPHLYGFLQFVLDEPTSWASVHPPPRVWKVQFFDSCPGRLLTS